MEREMEEKYGKNDMNMLVVCDRCLEAVPAFLRTITTEDRFEKTVTQEVHGLKCRHDNHKDGTLINVYNTVTTEKSADVS